MGDFKHSHLIIFIVLFVLFLADYLYASMYGDLHE